MGIFDSLNLSTFQRGTMDSSGKSIDIDPKLAGDQTIDEAKSTRYQKRQHFPLTLDVSDFFINSGIFTTQEGKKDYIKEGRYIGYGDLGYVQHSGSKNPHDYMLFFEDLSGIHKAFGFYERIATGLRVISEDGKIVIKALAQPEIDDSSLWNGRDEIEDVYRKLQEDNETSVQELDISSEAGKNLLKLIFEKYSAGYSPLTPSSTLDNLGSEFYWARSRSDVDMAEIFKNIFRKTFSDLEQKIRDAKTFDERKSHLADYTKLYATFREALGEQKANEIIYGKNLDAFNILIKNITETMTQSAAGSNEDPEGLNKTLIDFLHELRTNLGIDGKSRGPYVQKLNDAHSKAVFDFIEKTYGIKLSENDRAALKTKVTELLDRNVDNSAELLSSLIKDAKILAASTIGLKLVNRHSEHKWGDFDTVPYTKGLVETFKKLGLPEYKEGQVVILKSKTDPQTFVFITNSEAKNYEVKAIKIDISSNGIKEVEARMDYSELQALTKAQIDSLLNNQSNTSLTAEQQLAIVDSHATLGITAVESSTQFIKDVNFKTEAGRIAYCRLIRTVSSSGDWDKVLSEVFGLTKKDTADTTDFNAMQKLITEYLKADESNKKTKFVEIKKFKDSLDSENPNFIKLNQFIDDVVDIEEPSQLAVTAGLSIAKDALKQRNLLVKRKIFDLVIALKLHRDTTGYDKAKDLFTKSIVSLIENADSLNLKEKGNTIATELIALVEGVEINGLDQPKVIEKIPKKIDELLAKNGLVSEVNVTGIQSLPSAEIQSLLDAMKEMSSSENPLDQSDVNFVRDLILSLNSGVKLHPIQTDKLKSILQSHNLLSNELIVKDRVDFNKFINEEFVQFFMSSPNKDAMISNCGLKEDDIRIESLISQLILGGELTAEQKAKLTINAIDQKFFIQSEGKIQDIPIDQEILQVLERLIKEREPDLSRERLNEIIFRFLLRNTISRNNGIDYSNTAFSASIPTLPINPKLSLLDFSKKLREDPAFAKKFFIEQADMSRSFDRLDATRRYNLARLLESEQYRDVFANIAPGTGNYSQQLDAAVKEIKRIVQPSKFPGFMRVNPDGTTVRSITEAVTKDDLIKYIGDLKITLSDDGANIREVENFNKLLELFKNLKIAISEEVGVIDTKDKLLELLNIYNDQNFSYIGRRRNDGQLGLNNFLLDYLVQKINSNLTKAKEIQSNPSSYQEDYINKILARSQYLNEAFGKYELVSDEEIKYSLAYMIEAAYYAANPSLPKPDRTPKPVAVPPPVAPPAGAPAPGAGAPAVPDEDDGPVALLQRINLNLFNWDDEMSLPSSDSKKQKEILISGLSSNFSRAA